MLSICHHTTDEKIQSVVSSISGSLLRTTYTKWQTVALQYKSLSTRNRLQHLFKSEKPKKLQIGPALPITASNRTANKNSEEPELSVLRPSYSRSVKFTNFKTVASKLPQFSSHLPLTHCLFISLSERGHECAVNILTGLWVLEFCNVSDPQLCRQ